MPPFRTDKVDHDHGYLPFYLNLAAQIQRPTSWGYANADGRRPIIVELGVRDGSSLDMWTALFPGALIIGVDDDTLGHAERGIPGTHFINGKQQDPNLWDTIHSVIARNNETGHDVMPDLIVDDAGHDGKLALESWLNLWPYVVPGGHYVIEDWYVGFEHWQQYDDSMLTALLPALVGEFRTKDITDVESMTLRYGLIDIVKVG